MSETLISDVSAITNTTYQFQSARYENLLPIAYRLAKKTNGELVLQGQYMWTGEGEGGYEWRDIPTIELMEI